MIVRDAQEGDITAIVRSIERFVSVSSYGQHDEVNRDHVIATLNQLIAADDGCVAVMEDAHGTFAGCFVGLAHPHLFSAARLLGELFIYTTPEARGNGRKLRVYAEEWAKAHGCKTFSIAHPESESHLAKVYARWGFVPCETHYRKELT